VAKKSSQEIHIEELIGEEMNRRTFIKAAAGSPILVAGASAVAEQDLVRKNTWPETIALDNPIAHPYPVHFIEEVPLLIRGSAWTSASHKEPELFRFMAQEWVCDAMLVRGIQIKQVDLFDWSNQELLDTQLSLYVEGQKVLDRAPIADFMKEGGCAFPLHGCGPTKALPSVFMGWGWLEKEGFLDHNQFLGYFLPNKECIVGKVENHKGGSISVEIELDMARYSTKKKNHQRTER